MAFRFLLSLALVVGVVRCQVNSVPTLAKIPGGQTASAIMASSANGASRYLAPDGPIQPAITATMGLPMRAGEMANNGITRISSGLNSGAQRLSQAAGQNGQIRMPGMDALESSMPLSIASMSQSMQSMIRNKNQFIMNQAQRGIDAGNRLGQMMHQGLKVRSSGPQLMKGPMEMIGSAQEFLVRGGSTVQNQLRQHLDGTMSRLGSVQDMGQGMRNQAQSVMQTMSSGVQGAMGQLQHTGESVLQQLQNNHHKNTQAMSGILGSLQSSMGNMGGTMQKNMEGLARQAQSTGQQLSSSLQQAAQTPMKMLSNLGSSLGGAMSSGNRY